MLLVTHFFENGELPNILKIGVINPMFMSGNRMRLSNYKAICLTSKVAKIVEKVLKIKMINSLDENKIISQSRYGFWTSKSTEDAKSKLVRGIYSLFENNIGPCVFIDLARAFDSKSQKKLHHKTYLSGFWSEAYNLICWTELKLWTSITAAAKLSLSSSRNSVRTNIILELR